MPDQTLHIHSTHNWWLLTDELHISPHQLDIKQESQYVQSRELVKTWLECFLKSYTRSHEGCQWPFQQELTSGTSRIHHFIETLDSPAAKEMGCHNKYILAKCLDSWWGVPVCVHTWGDNSSNHLDCLLPAPLVDSLQQLEPQGHAHPATAPFVVTCYPGPQCHCHVVPSYFLWWSR